MTVRNATERDLDQLVGLVADFYQEVPYDAPLINPEKTRIVLQAYLNALASNPDAAFFQVIDDDGTLVGFMIGERAPDLWSDAVRTIEIALYVRRLWRGRLSAGRLLLNFADWANKMPSIIRVEASSGISEGRAAEVYSKLGWEHRGTLHGKETH